METRPATIFCDLDGTLVEHSNLTDSQLPSHKLQLLDGTLEKLREWEKKGFRIILQKKYMSNRYVNRGVSAQKEDVHRAIKNIDRGDWRSRQKENEMRTVSEDDTLDYIPSINLSPPKITEEPRNKSGHTEAQKSRMAHQWTIRPPDNIKKMVKKNMPMLT